MTDNEFILADRIAKIKSVVEKYGEDNFYISFSGGKDSTVLSALVDMAVPGNKIPRVFANTGIEYQLIVDFVEKEKEKEHEWDLIILKPSQNIKAVLEQYGYPFKSKLHSKKLGIYQRNGMSTAVVNYLDPQYGVGKFRCPEMLRYQFQPDFGIKVDYKCCVHMKEKPLYNWSKENNRPISIVGIMQSEGGARVNGKCMTFSGDTLKSFAPLIHVTEEWEEWFIREYDIDISDIYKPPYNFFRTGCKGCPFTLHLQAELDQLEKFFPHERKQCELIWGPIYNEYRRIGYRIKDDYKLDDNN